MRVIKMGIEENGNAAAVKLSDVLNDKSLEGKTVILPVTTANSSPSSVVQQQQPAAYTRSEAAMSTTQSTMGTSAIDGLLDQAPIAVPGTSLKDSQVVRASRPRARKKWTNRYVKILIIGDSGLGKTTLVNCLLAVPGEKLKLHDGSSTTFSEFQRDPESCLSTITWDNEEDCIHWTYQIQDTPGYGDDLNVENNIERVKNYLHTQDSKWHDIETAASREHLSQAVDPRVDLCIFVLPPHRVRNIDLLFMWEISQVVPVLPVVTKADTMTIEECVQYRTEVNAKLRHPGLPGKGKPVNVFQFSADTLQAVSCPTDAMAQAMRPPYLVVCSNKFNEDRMQQPEPELWPERRYMWGTSEAFNEKHSDLLLLRRLLLQEGVEEIADSKIERYEAWRSRRMKTVRPLRALGKVLLTTVLTVATIAAALHFSGAVDMSHVAVKVKDKVEEVAEETRTTVVETTSNVLHGAAELAENARAKLDEKAEVKEEVKEEKKPFWKPFG